MGKILLTGGTGFIGSHTAVELIKKGYEVVIADDLSNSESSVIERIEKIAGKKPVFYQIDVKDFEKTSVIFKEQKIDAVINFAGFKAVGESVEKPLMYYQNNIGIVLNLLQVMKLYACKVFIFSSSACVYGEKSTPPYSETSPAGDCTNPYGRTKFMCEEILKDAAKADPALCNILLRYFNPVGADESGLIGENPNGRPNNLMPSITQAAIGKRKEIFVFGTDYDTPDGSGVRDYIHVTDLAKGHIAALEYALKHTGAEIFNLGTGRGFSVLEMLSSFEKVNGIKLPVVIANRRPGDIATSYASVEKAEKLLGWRAEKGIEEMCKDAWHWEKNNRKVTL